MLSGSYLTFRKLLFLVSLTILSVLAISVLQANRAHAAQDICVWSGSGGNPNWSNSSNWVPGTCDTGMPEDGDDITFPNGGSVSTNDISGLDLRTILFYNGDHTINGNNGFGMSAYLAGQGSTNGTMIIEPNITLNGNAGLGVPNGSLTLLGDLIMGSNNLLVGASANASIQINGIVSGSGAISKQGVGSFTLAGSNTYSGQTTIDAGTIYARHAIALGGSGTTTVASGAALQYELDASDATIPETISLAGSGTSESTTLAAVYVGNGEPNPIPIYTFSGLISLNSNDVKIGSNMKTKLSNVLSGSGGFTFQNEGEGIGSLELTGNNTFSSTQTLSSIVSVNGVIINAPTVVANGGVLKGQGTVSLLTVQNGGKVAPGNSPGCLTARNTAFASGSSLDVEIAGTTVCTEYDQLKVNGTVDLGGATLNLTRLNNFVPTVGQVFTIIENDSNDTVTGTFAGLAQGATTVKDGVTYRIDYGDASNNDIRLTVTAVDPAAVAAAATTPGTPNTGLKLLMANPLLTLGASLTATVALAVIATRYKFTGK